MGTAVADAARAKCAQKLLGASGILQLTRPHEASDLSLTCRCAQSGAIVELFCHTAVLGQHFSLIAGLQRFEESSCRVATSSIDVPMDDDIVFEVLRYVYCRYICLPAGFRKRFSELLRVVDFLGLQDTEAFFDEPSLRSVVRSMPADSLQSAMLGTSFAMRCAITGSAGIADRKPLAEGRISSAILRPSESSSEMHKNLAGVHFRDVLLECLTSEGVAANTNVGHFLDTVARRCDMIDPVTTDEARSILGRVLTVSHEDGAIRIVWHEGQHLN